MRPPALGTILPDWKKETANNAFLMRQRREMRQKSINNPQLQGCSIRWEQMEERFYKNETEYAIISQQDGRILWFFRKPDGHWYAKK